MFNEKKPEEKTLDEKTLEGVTGGYDSDDEYDFADRFIASNCNRCRNMDCPERGYIMAIINQHYGESICPSRED